MIRSIEEMRTSAAGGAVTVEQVKRRTALRIPLQRYGAPEEVARMMLYLASDGAVFAPGACIWSMGACLPVPREMCGRKQRSPRASSAK